MIKFKEIPEELRSKHGNFYCMSCKDRGNRVMANFIPSYPDTIKIALEFASCEIHIDEREFLLNRRLIREKK